MPDGLLCQQKQENIFYKSLGFRKRPAPTCRVRHLWGTSVLDRVSSAIEPHYEAISEVTHNAAVNHVDEMSWRPNGKLTGLWVMGNALTGGFKVHDERSKKAFKELRGNWTGILVSDDYGLYLKWVGQRQTCLAHLIRMANAPPSEGEWNMFYARFIRLTTRYGEDKSEAGAFVRRLRPGYG